MTAYDIFTITSTIAGCCMAVCQIPQAWAIHKTHNTEGISLGMQVILTTGIGFWLVSGIILSALIDFRSGIPMWLSNGTCFLLCCYILIEIMKNKKHNEK